MRFLKTNRRAFCALTLSALVVSGQAAEKADQTVLLSEFTVKESSDIGYIASESVTGTRVATQIKDLPFSVSVITSEFMNDFDFFEMLHRAGRRAARRFLDGHYSDIGVRGTIDSEAKSEAAANAA